MKNRICASSYIRLSAITFYKKGLSFLLFFFLLSLILIVPNVYASTSSITTTAQFQNGLYTNTESTSKEGELKLQADGTWNARIWRTPFLTLTDGTTFANDGTYTYMLIGRDLRFVKYLPAEDRWKELAIAPHMPNSGADMVVVGDNIYVIYGGYQKYFSKYSIGTNTWTDLTTLPDFVYSGSSIQTDGTNLYIMRGANTSDFWKYDISAGTYTTLTAPPANISTGADLVFDNSTGTSYLFTPRGANTTTFYRYDIVANSWSTMSAAPASLNDNGNITISGDYIYTLRGTNTTTFYKYRISTDTWSTIAATPAAARYVGVTYNPTEDVIYVFRGNSTYDWWKYDPDTDTFAGPTDLPNTPGNGADIIYGTDYIYFRRGNNNTAFYRYNIDIGGTWQTLTSAPAAFNDDNKGIKAGNYLYFFRGGGTTTFYRYDISGNSWSTMGVTPATASYGSSLAYPGSGNYIYGTRGSLTTSFWRYSISGDTWDDASVADLPTGALNGYGARLVSDGTDIYAITGSGIAKMYRYVIGTNTWSLVGDLPFSPYWGTDIVYMNGRIYAQSGYYKSDFWEYVISSNTWRKLPDMAGYYASDIGPYNGGSIAADTDNGMLYSINGTNISRLLSFDPSSYNYPATGNWVSASLDLTYVSSWNSLTYSSSTPSDSSITFQTRSSSDKITWGSWQNVVSSTIASTPHRYLQLKAILNSSSDKSVSPTLFDVSVSFNGDTTPPTNPTGFTASSQAVGGTSLTSGNTYKHANPYFTWSGASDTESSISGYYVYFGTDSGADPQTYGNFQSESTYTVTTPMSTGTYYVRLRAKDSAGNISSSVTEFTYVYSGVSPPSTSTYNSSADFVLGTSDEVSVTNDQIKLNGKIGFWQQQRLSTIPAAVGYGASFAHVSSTGKLYAFRGNNTTSFYEYDIATDTWTTKAVTPAAVYQGGEVIEGPSGYLYGFRGANTTSFWRYDITTDTWSDAAAADAPLALYYGSAMIYDGDQYIYALRGNTDDAFMRYDTTSDTWATVANVDFGSPTNQVDNNVYVGGDLAFDGDDTIYAIQGNTRTGFASYNISTDTWTPLPNVPILAYDGAQISYDSATQAIYLTSGWTNPFIYKYNIATQTWSKLTDSPAPIQYGGAMRDVGGILYIMRGGGQTTFWKYNIAKDSWLVPNVGLFGTEFRGTDYRPFGYGAEIVKGNGNYFYLVRGNFDNLFVRYDYTTGESVRMADAPEGYYIGSALTYDSVHNKIYTIPSQYSQRLYVYDIGSNTWTQESNDAPPAAPSTGSSLQFDGSRYIYWLRGGSTGFYRFDTQGSSGSKWTQMANVTGSIGYGGDLVYIGGYIYAVRGNNTLSFYRYDVSGNSWSDAAVADLPSGGTIYNDGFLVKPSSDLIIACRGGNQVGCYQYVISTNTWSAIDNAPANIYQGGAAATNGSDRMLVIAGNGTNTFANGLYSYIIGTSNSAFEESGSYISPVHDLTATYKFANISVGYTSASNAVLGVSTRTSADNDTFSSWTDATELKTVGNTYIYKVNSTPQRYIQVKFTFSSTDGVYSGVVTSYSIQHYADTSAPSNPTSLSAYSNSSMATGITTNNWYASTAPYFDWPDEDATGGATDTSAGSGIQGYYLYYGTNSSANPVVSGSLITDTNYTGIGMSSGSTYYLRITTIDTAGNTSPTVWQPFIYKLDNNIPSNPSTVSANPPGYTATNSFTFSWSGATDAESGIASYCYKTGEAGYVETCTTSTSVSSITSYKTGANTFYVRAKDNAGNYSSDYATSSYYYSSVAPSAPEDLAVSPSTNTVNQYAFTWSPPDVYYGAQAGLRYYYSVNALPTSSNVNSVGLEVTYLSSGAYATQNGNNTLYVVAKDEAGNIDYNNYASVDFESNTSSPGVPLNVEISDVSVKETSSWKIALSWEPPTDTGSGLSTYKVYRSAVEGASCSADFTNFTYISSTTVKSFVDTDLEQQTYAYCVKACTSTNVCSAPSSTEELLPDGRWRVAPTLVGDPSASVLTKAATITWATARKGSSFVKYGKSSGDYGSEVGSSELITSHEIDITGLDPGTTYYYKVLWTDEDGNTGESDEYTFDTEAAPFVSDVKFSNVSLYQALVNFTIKNAVQATVQYGTTLSYGSVKTISTSKSESTYTVPLEELTDGTVYHLRIVAEDNEGNTYNGDDYSFETLPVPKIAGVRVQQVDGMPSATLRLLWISNTRLSSIVTYYPTSQPQLSKDAISLTPRTQHEIILKDLLDETNYTILVKGKDAAGNEARSESRSIKTAADLRPPEIQNPNVETTIVGVGEEARAQIIISWDTDEPSTSQVEYGEGTSGQYTSSTQEDTSLTSNHSMTVPGLSPSKIYHFRITSKDKNANKGLSQDVVVITPNATQDALNLVVNKLSKTFGFLKNTKLIK